MKALYMGKLHGVLDVFEGSFLLVPDDSVACVEVASDDPGLVLDPTELELRVMMDDYEGRPLRVE